MPAPFKAIEISQLAHRMKSEGRSIIHMEFGQPSTGAPAAAIAVAHQVLDTDGMGYWESPALRERIALHYRQAYGVVVDPARIILTCGASPALVLALSSRFAVGDRIALARPGYIAYRNTLKALNMVPVELACGPETLFQLSAAMVEALDPAPAGLIIASPANPTGTIIEGDELAAIASKLGKIPTVAEYHEAMGIINKDAASVYRYMNFDQIEEYQDVAKTVAA